LTQKACDRLTILATDVTDAQSVRAAAAQVGDTGIDLLVNCAGITGMPGQKVGKVNYESWAILRHRGSLPWSVAGQGARMTAS
jgi:NAD(P)-dependent dehydrogenase (short-subunit alcohol dehydrogenase family)